MPCVSQRDGFRGPSTFTARVIRRCIFLLPVELFRMQRGCSKRWIIGVPKRRPVRFARHSKLGKKLEKFHWLDGVHFKVLKRCEGAINQSSKTQRIAGMLLG